MLQVWAKTEVGSASSPISESPARRSPAVSLMIVPNSDLVAPGRSSMMVAWFVALLAAALPSTRLL